jgi:hypothetical protein
VSFLDDLGSHLLGEVLVEGVGAIPQPVRHTAIAVAGFTLAVLVMRRASSPPYYDDFLALASLAYGLVFSLTSWVSLRDDECLVGYAWLALLGSASAFGAGLFSLLN